MTAVATWYRFMIGMAPLIIPLTVKGAEKLGTRFLILYLVFLATRDSSSTHPKLDMPRYWCQL
jgi:hypothetical protein